LRLDDGHRPHGDAFLAAESAKALCPAALDGDGCTCRFTEPLLHRRPVWRQFRCLTDNRTVDVTDHEPRFVHERDRVAQQHQRIDALPLRVRVGKVLANVAQTGGAQQRISHRVGDRVGVAVPVQATSSLERHPSQHQRSRRVVTETMNVEPLPHTNHWSLPSNVSPCPGQIVGAGDLAIVRVAGHHDHASTGRLDQRCVVGGHVADQIGSAQHVRTKRLRCLHGHQLSAVRRVHNQAVAGDLLDRVGHLHARDRAVGTSHNGGHHTVKYVTGGERARPVVHAHDGRLGGDLRQPCPNGLAARRSASDSTLASDIRSRNNDHHTIAGSTGRSYRPVQHSLRPQRLVLLETTETCS